MMFFSFPKPRSLSALEAGDGPGVRGCRAPALRLGARASVLLVAFQASSRFSAT